MGRKSTCNHELGVAKTIWPYNEGYGTYCIHCRMVLDTGIEKQDAQRIADEFNAKRKGLSHRTKMTLALFLSGALIGALIVSLLLRS